ncbi:MAG: ABC transporter ATP-binding protein [Gemmatimonadota bacterium]|nr:ABC transporter ATP-binding protein [Gemmatimonadota bacterium]MDE2983754.1 ABC transporter ATP-binding protein [Gemmatimonadota bacterium]
MPILELDALSLRFGGVTALSGLTMEVRRGELLALIGPNGAGKTSVLNCISGLYRAQEGTITLTAGDGARHRLHRLPPHRIAALGVARTFQNIELFKHMTVLENLMLGRHVHMKGGVLSGGLYAGRQRRTEIEHRRYVEEVIDFMNLEPLRGREVGNLAYGNQRLVEMARALALDPSLLLLDEPTAGMNAEEKESMARFILDVHEERGVTVLVIDHDIDVIMDIAERVIVLDFGRKIAEGTPGEVRGDPVVVDAYLGHARREGEQPAPGSVPPG